MVETALLSAAGLEGQAVIVDCLELEHAVAIAAGDRRDFRLADHWQAFRAEVGLDAGTARFQVWGDDRGDDRGGDPEPTQRGLGSITSGSSSSGESFHHRCNRPRPPSTAQTTRW